MTKVRQWFRAWQDRREIQRSCNVRKIISVDFTEFMLKIVSINFRIFHIVGNATKSWFSKGSVNVFPLLDACTTMLSSIESHHLFWSPMIVSIVLSFDDWVLHNLALSLWSSLLQQGKRFFAWNAMKKCRLKARIVHTFWRYE